MVNFKEDNFIKYFDEVVLVFWVAGLCTSQDATHVLRDGLSWEWGILGFFMQDPVALVIDDSNLRELPRQKTYGSDVATEWKEIVCSISELAYPQMCHFVFINFGKNLENVAKSNHYILRNWKQNTRK